MAEQRRATTVRVSSERWDRLWNTRRKLQAKMRAMAAHLAAAEASLDTDQPFEAQQAIRAGQSIYIDTLAWLVRCDEFDTKENVRIRVHGLSRRKGRRRGK